MDQNDFRAYLYIQPAMLRPLRADLEDSVGKYGGRSMTETDIAVIGGGAAGLMAAITAAGQGAGTVLIEHMDRVGKKILATGNGKCNYTNALQGIPYYRGENPAFVLPVFDQFGFRETIAFFQQMGIYPKCRNGYYYPASEQASSILDVLRMEADYRHVKTEFSCQTNDIKTQKDGFLISTNKDTFLAQRIIFATGLYASPKTGSDGSAIPLIEKFGHSIIDVVPALVALQGKQSFFKALAGIRAEISINLYIDNVHVQTEKGELQLTDYGISGIPVFQLSRYATKALHEKKHVYAELDFMPGLDQRALQGLLSERFYQYAHGKCANQSLIGLFHKKLIDILLKESRIVPDTPAELIAEKQLKRLCITIKRFRIDIIGSKSFENAQVCAGGVNTAELDGHTLESKLVKGLYFAGEVIDIDGTCGGYNLQWAWSSGYAAGLHAAKGLQPGDWV